MYSIGHLRSGGKVSFGTLRWTSESRSESRVGNGISASTLDRVAAGDGEAHKVWTPAEADPRGHREKQGYYAQGRYEE
jgi:hypothetical protein